MKSRFLRGNSLPTLNIIASSKNSEQSFLESFIESKRKNENKSTLIVDEPQWVVDSRKVTNEWFYVAIGNKFLANEVIPKDSPENLLSEYRARGYSLLKVPIAYYDNFIENIDGALTDIAGIATASSLKYISGIRWNEIKSKDYVNPFVKEIIEVGNAKGDVAQYSDFFDLSKVDRKWIGKPMYIHLDMSTSGDKTGIAGTWIAGKRPKIDGESSSKELFFRLAFSVSIKAPKGYEISFDKNRAFIRWLREQGFRIRGVSCDTYMSAQIRQQLSADNFEVSTVSVDRLDTATKQCLPYAYLKSTIYDRRLVVYDKCDFLTEEVLGLERESDGRVDHPMQGTQGSKDSIDAVCGSVWNASQHADEYAYEYGEDIELSLNVSEKPSVESFRQQISVDFEEVLKQIHDPLGGIKQKDSFLDFGFGKAQVLGGSSDSTGICIL